MNTRPLLPAICVLAALWLTGCVSNPYLPPADVGAPPPGATRLADGLAYLVLQPGTGSAHPAADSVITVNYTGWTTRGRKFDSTVNPDGSTSPATFPLAKLIQGWRDVVPLMVAGERVRVWIPGQLAYDNLNRPGAPKGELVFDIQLISFK